MIIVKGEHYYNDYTRGYFERDFSDFDSFFEWAKRVSNNFNSDYGNYFPRVEHLSDGEVDVGRISIVDEANKGWDYFIYEIAIENGIVFANGVTTNHKKFIAKKVEALFDAYSEKIKSIREKQNFVEM